jgi:hypothetical protein
MRRLEEARREHPSPDTVNRYEGTLDLMHGIDKQYHGVFLVTALFSQGM